MEDTRTFGPMYYRSVESGTTETAGTLANSVTVTATNANAVASTVFPGTLRDAANSVLVSNKTSAWAHVNFGVLRSGFTVTAATVANSMPVAPGSQQTFSIDPEVNAASVILDAAPAGNASVIFTVGTGI